VKAKQESLFGNDSQSLGRQISRATDRLDQRRRTAGALSTALRSRMRSGLASPGGLWIAACAGFVAAEWVHRPERAPHPASKQASNSPRRPQATALAKAVMLLKLVEDLRLIWTKAGPASTAGVRQRTEDQRVQAHAVETLNEPGQ
jgi:hypothetical protein